MLAAKHTYNCIHGGLTYSLQGSGCVRGAMRREDHLGHAQKRILRVGGLLFQHVQAGARQPPFLERRMRAASLTKAPRPQLISIAVGFISASRAASSR